jgi:hypothetical protein
MAFAGIHADVLDPREPQLAIYPFSQDLEVCSEAL